MLILLILVLPVIHGFLLENNHSIAGQTTLSSQYLKTSTFLDEKNRLQQATERISQNNVQLRHDMDTNLAVLSSQLLKKFNVLEQQLEEVKQLNETQKELALIQHKHVTLEQKYNILQNNYNQLKRENILFHHELLLLKNVSNNTSKELSDLKHLGTIKPLQDISNLQQSIQSLLSKTQTLSMTEHARSQDFLALYNMTISSHRSVIEIDKQIGSRIDDLERKINDTLEKNETVALLAYPSFNGNTHINGVVKFNDIEFSVGVNDMSAFKISGIFICEKRGVYLVFVSTASSIADKNIRVVLNGNHISNTLVSNGHWLTGTTAISIQLRIKDKLWIEADNLVVAPRPYTFFSIVKVQ